MDMSFTPEENAFRQEVREWIQSAMPPHIKSKAEVDGLHAFLTTPWFDGEHIYGVGGLGHLHCIEAASGRELWRTSAPTEDARIATAFLVKNGDRFLIANDTGQLIIAKLSPQGYEEISRSPPLLETTHNAFGRPVVWSPPAFANGGMFWRNDQELIRVSLAAD